MIPCARRVSVAVLVSLTAATTCLAETPGGAPGKGSVGGQIGGSYFRIDRAFGADWFGDYSAGAQTRFSFQGQWRYQVNDWLRWQLGLGFTWAAYSKGHPAPFVDPNFPDDPDKGDYLTQVIPVTFQVQYVMDRGPWKYHAGAGPGLYRLWVENQRKVLKDPITLELHRGIYPGVSSEMGVERFLKDLPNTSLEVSFSGHLLFSHDSSPDPASGLPDFPSGLSDNVMALELKVGANYYFAPGPRKAPPPSTKPF